MNKYCMITTTFDDESNAMEVMERLLKERLVSCAQMGMIKSAYHWKGKIESSNEFLIQLKTKKTLYKEVEKTIIELHNYETPQIIMYDIVDGYSGYLDWIEKETK